MSKYLFNCAKCTYKKVNADGVFCKAIVEGHKACHIISGESAKEFVFGCDYYTTQPRQIEFYERQNKTGWYEEMRKNI